MRFCLLGAGEIGGLRARSVARNPDTELVAVADVDDARAARAAAGTGARVYADYRALLEETESDAVIVSSPVPLHEEMILAALNSGKLVLCEKPLAGTQHAEPHASLVWSPPTDANLGTRQREGEILIAGRSAVHAESGP